MARARGSYPRCRWFKSSSRYYKKESLCGASFCVISILSFMKTLNIICHIPTFYTQTIKFTNIKLQAIHCLKISQQSTPPIQKPLINLQLHRCLNSTFPRQPLPSAAVFSEKVSRRRKNIPPDSMFGQRNPVGYFFSSNTRSISSVSQQNLCNPLKM